MSDVMVTLPKSFGLARWIAEGDPAGTDWSGREWHWYCAGPIPIMEPGDRLYIWHNEVLRGYAPIVRIERYAASFAFVRHGGAVAVTIRQHIPGFRGWRYINWSRDQEVPFPNWWDPSARLYWVDEPLTGSIWAPRSPLHLESQ